MSFQFVDPERDPLKAKEAGYRFPGNVLAGLRWPAPDGGPARGGHHYQRAA